MDPVPSERRFDLRMVLETPVRQFAPWLAAVLLASWAGYPGIVCITPLAWLVALRVGIVCAIRSTSQVARRRVQEAALAGGIYGLLAGGLFWILTPRMGPIQPDEKSTALLISIGMVIIGIFASAGLAAFTASQYERRHRR